MDPETGFASDTTVLPARTEGNGMCPPPWPTFDLTNSPPPSAGFF